MRQQFIKLFYADDIQLNQSTSVGDKVRAFDDGTRKHMGAWINGLERKTYIVPINRIQNTALAANTTRQQVSFEHAANSTKTMRLRKLHLGALNTTAVAGDLRVFIDTGTAASSAGTALTPQPMDPADSATPDTVVKTLPTIVAGTTKFCAFIGSAPATANSAIPGLVVYEWYPGSEEKQFKLRPGFLDTMVVGIQSFGLNVYHVSGYAVFTEE